MPIGGRPRGDCAKLEAVTWRADVAFLEGLGLFGGVVALLAPDQWGRPTPCAGWRAVDVVGHVGTAVRFGTALLAGEAPAWDPVDPPGLAVEGDPATWWRVATERAPQVVAAADLAQVMDSPMGRRSVEEGLAFPALDLFVHAWDLARSGALDLEVPAEAVDFAHRVVDPIPDELVRNARVFAGSVRPRVGATATEAFIAWTGRDPAWQPSRR